jgi:hypothetical protein
MPSAGDVEFSLLLPQNRELVVIPSFPFTKWGIFSYIRKILLQTSSWTDFSCVWLSSGEKNTVSKAM